MTKKIEIKKEDIKYEIGDIELIDYVEPLWTQLNKLHLDRSINFKYKYENNTFKDRKNSLLKEEKNLMIVLAKVQSTDEYIGYSISSISKDNIGEIDSIYIDSRYRGLQIGDMLMKKPLEWMTNKCITKIIVGVAAGNEDVFPFYSKFGFYPKATILEQP